MKPSECGTFRLPPENTPDREVVDAFAQYLREAAARGQRAARADPAWQSWELGEGPAPAVWVGCAVPR